jgi:site-specific recombinase XerD
LGVNVPRKGKTPKSASETQKKRGNLPTKIDSDIDLFLIDCQSRNLSSGTLRFYTQKLEPLSRFLEELGVATSKDITAAHMRAWSVALQDSHTAGGCHSFYRAAKVWLRWLYNEQMLDENPMARVRAPKVAEEVLEPVSIDAVRAMTEVCDGKSVMGRRDRCILFGLMDSGCRASELLDLNCGDFNAESGALVVRSGKGRKVRTVFLGAISRRELGKYLKMRKNTAPDSPLFASRYGKRIAYQSLRSIVKRLAKRANVEAPSLHSFRRAFALNCLRNGVDLISLQRLLGHSDLSVIKRYLAQTDSDLQAAHKKGGPVDRLF